MKTHVRKLAIVVVLFVSSLLTSPASAQQADVAFGLGTITSDGSTPTCIAPAINEANGCGASETGGLFPAVSADLIFHKRYGLNFEASMEGGSCAR